jgi:hypothetical protein
MNLGRYRILNGRVGRYSDRHGVQALASSDGTISGVLFFMLSFLAAITTLAAVGDIRMMRSAASRATPRLRRHLWQTCFALFIAAGSFFDPRTCRKDPSRAIYDPMMRPSHSAGVCGDVLLAVACSCRARVGAINKRPIILPLPSNGSYTSDYFLLARSKLALIESKCILNFCSFASL